MVWGLGGGQYVAVSEIKANVRDVSLASDHLCRVWLSVFVFQTGTGVLRPYLCRRTNTLSSSISLSFSFLWISSSVLKLVHLHLQHQSPSEAWLPLNPDLMLDLRRCSSDKRKTEEPLFKREQTRLEEAAAQRSEGSTGTLMSLAAANEARK